MFENELLEFCQSFFGKKIDAVLSLGGSSFSSTFKISIGSDKFFIKKSSSVYAYEMLEAEIKGLQLLKESKTVAVPKILKLGKVNNDTFLILEYIKDQPKSILFWEKFGRELAQLHQNTSSTFGLGYSNFIGNLAQQNNYKSKFVDFYIEERITPQLELAKEKNLMPGSYFSHFQQLFKNVAEIFPEEPPSLIHGDLWNGNFLVGKEDIPILIDPSVNYSHREMDLAMSRLFGGFSKRFYESYNETFPLQPNFEKRVELYQLYYLLVHLNLFGSSYLESVGKIVKRFAK